MNELTISKHFGIFYIEKLIGGWVMRKGLSVWSPILDIERIRREFDRLFDEFLCT